MKIETYCGNHFAVRETCEECKNKINGEYQMPCWECKHYYACMFEPKEEGKNENTY